MALNGKEENNMLIGDPYKFAIIFDRVAAWNASLSDNNGYFSFCIDGKLFPEIAINAILSVSVKEVKNSLVDIPVNEEIFDMDSKDAIPILYDLVYPEYDDEKSDEENKENDFRYLISIEELDDDKYYAFAVKKDEKIRILGAKGDYDFEENSLSFDNSEILEIILEKDEINNIIRQLEEVERCFNDS